MKTGDLLDGKYRLLERLGAGGMGEVYKAEHVLLGTMRVIKVVRPQIAEHPEAHERFLREARLATRVHHQNVATLHDFAALPDGAHYMVFELIDGENLAQVLKRRGPLPPQEAIRIAVQALHGLDAIHRAGIVHRDISPENLMVAHDDRSVKIIDLGVAKGTDSEATMTQTGMFIGKLRYASPEHLGMMAEGERIDGRADLYSLAIVLYEMLAGRPPFETTSPHQYVMQLSRETIAKSLDLSPIPLPLRQVLARALDRDRNRRYANANEFAAALEAIHIGDEAPTVITPMPSVLDVQRKRSRALPLMIGAVVVLAILAVLTTRPWSSREVKVAAPAPTPAPATVAVTTTTAAPPAPAQTTVTVGSSAPAGPVGSSGASVPRQEPQETPATQETRGTRGTEEPRNEAPPPAPAHVATYFDSKGDSSHNDEALNAARTQLHGVTKVAVDANADPDLTSRLVDLLKRDGLTVSDSADVVIHFKGSVEHLRFGRKVRAGSATITRGGRVVFHYELPSEEYRVGDNPAEAFARIAGDLFR